MKVSVKSKGNWEKTTKLLERTSKQSVKMDVLREYGELGVQALSTATPKDTGETASSWYYTIKNQNGKYSIVFNNRNVVDGVPIAIILQYGHATRNEGWVEGRDYINPALRPIFDGMAKKVWREAIE